MRRVSKSASRSLSQSIRFPSKSSSPRCTISSPPATVQGEELHSALSPSTACSLGASVVAGSCTWSDGMGSVSGAILRSVALHCSGSLIAAGNGSPSSVGSGLRLSLCSSRRRRYSGPGAYISYNSGGDNIHKISQEEFLKGTQIIQLQLFL